MIQTKGNGELKLSKHKGQEKRPGREKKDCASTEWNSVSLGEVHIIQEMKNIYGLWKDLDFHSEAKGGLSADLWSCSGNQRFEGVRGDEERMPKPEAGRHFTRWHGVIFLLTTKKKSLIFFIPVVFKCHPQIPGFSKFIDGVHRWMLFL